MKLSPSKSTFRVSLGNRGEMVAWNFLREEGYTIRDKNYRCPIGEIDVVAKKDGRIHFIEIKTRSSDHYGSPAEAVHKAKQRKLVKLAQWYLKAKGIEDVRISFSVVPIQWTGDDEPKIGIIQDAFGADTPI